jgi:Flp pilus assembly pilin Flp
MLAGEETGGQRVHAPKIRRRRRRMRLLNEALLRAMTWLRREKGQTLIEYGLIAALVSIVIVAAFATGLNGAFTALVTKIRSALQV